MSEEDVVTSEQVEPEEPEEEESEDESDDDDDGDGRRIILSTDEFRAHRVDALEIAWGFLKGKDWGDYTVDAADVLVYARFIEGDE